MVTNTDIYNQLKYVRNDIECVDEKLKWVLKDNTRQQVETMTSQQRTIDCLIDALCGKYEHGIFIFTEEGKFAPTIIKDGQVLTNDRVSYVDISWDYSQAPSITIEYA